MPLARSELERRWPFRSFLRGYIQEGDRDRGLESGTAVDPQADNAEASATPARSRPGRVCSGCAESW